MVLSEREKIWKFIALPTAVCLGQGKIVHSGRLHSPVSIPTPHDTTANTRPSTLDLSSAARACAPFPRHRPRRIDSDPRLRERERHRKRNRDREDAMAVRTLGDVVRRSEPLVAVNPDDTVEHLAHVLHEKRVDAVAVMRGRPEFLGLITSRDIAACVARREALRDVLASQIMTTAPVTLQAYESPVRALQIMRSGRFRHVPVLENGILIGIVDVLHLAYDAITRLQQSYELIPSKRTFDFLRTARANIEKPTLRPMVEQAPLVTLQRFASVSDACEALVKNHLTAVVIVDEHGVLDGIFTCRDVSTRVVAKDRDPDTTVIEKVMTLNPDSASPDFTILESLQRMQACSYRHLPVVEDHSRKVVGLVNVLQLASDALLGTANSNSNSHSPHQQSGSSPRRSPSNHSVSSRNGLGSFFSSLFSSSTYVPPPQPTPAKRKSIGAPNRSADRREFSNLSRREVLYSDSSSTVPFKFKDCNGDFRKLRVSSPISPGAYNQLVIDVRRRYYGGSKATAPIKIKYVDEDGDPVVIANDEDLAACLADAKRLQGKAVNLRVSRITQDGNSLPSSAATSVQGSPYVGPLTPKQFSPPSVVTGTPGATSPQSSSVTSDPGAAPSTPTPSDRCAQTAHSLMMDNQIERAIAEFNQALVLDSTNARAMGGRGAAKLIGGDSTGAEEDYRAAVAMLDSTGGIGPVFEMCVSGLVEALIDQRRYEEALIVASRKDARGALQRCIDAFAEEIDLTASAARKSFETGEYVEAMGLYSSSIRVEMAYLELDHSAGARADIRIGRAKCYAQLEDFDMALEDYEAALEIEPESVSAAKGCARCLAELEQSQRALDLWKLALKLDCADEEAQKEVDRLSGNDAKADGGDEQDEPKATPSASAEDKKTEIAKLGAMLGGLKFNK